MPVVFYPPNATTGVYSSSVWAGLGDGDPAHPLIQAGTEQDAGTSGSANYYFWYEIYPLQTEQPIYSIPVNSGDNVGAVVFWVPSSHTAVLGVCNWNTSTCISFNVSSVQTSTGGYVNVGEPGNTTEWIVEAPSIDGVIQPLPQFSPVNFINGCWAATTTLSVTSKPNTIYALSNAQQGANGMTGSFTCYDIASGPSLTAIDMEMLYGSSWQVISSPSGLGSNGSDFQVNYVQP